MDKIKRHEEILNEMHELYKNKNSDYGDSCHLTYERYGIDSYLVRIEDKLNRLYSLTRKEAKQKVNDEKLIDTLTDLANYCILARIELEETNK